MKLPKGVAINRNKTSNSLRISFYDQFGKRHRPVISLPPTKPNIRYAELKLNTIKLEVEKGTFSYDEHFPNKNRQKRNSQLPTLRELGEDFIESAYKRRLSPSTLDGYRKCLKSFELIFDTTIDNLDFELFIDWIEAQTTSAKTIRNRLSFLRSSLDKAVVKKLLTNNPLRMLNISQYLPRNINKHYSHIEPFTPNEMRQILDNANLFYRTKIQLWWHTGLRSGEIVELRWKHINFELNALEVNSAAYNRQSKGTKTNTRRFLPLDDEMMAALKFHRSICTKIKKNDYIFLNAQGLPWLQDSFRKHQWKKLLMKSGVKYRYPYQLRHSFATKHISKGENLWKIANLMGHKSPQMLYQHYGRFIDEYNLLNLKGK